MQKAATKKDSLPKGSISTPVPSAAKQPGTQHTDSDTENDTSHLSDQRHARFSPDARHPALKKK